jgi:hypothetical protein
MSARDELVANYRQSAEQRFGARIGSGERIVAAGAGFVRPAWAHPLILNEGLGMLFSKYFVVAVTQQQLFMVRTAIRWSGSGVPSTKGEPEQYRLDQIELIRKGSFLRNRMLKMRMPDGSVRRLHMRGLWTGLADDIERLMRESRELQSTPG